MIGWQRVLAPVLAVLLLTASAFAEVISLERPADRQFVIDKADLITPADEREIQDIADRLLTDAASPILVVTIESMAQYTRRNIASIESFARVLFDQWGIGHLTIDNRPANKGMLFLISRDDRKARIELGLGWEYEKEAAVQQIMNGIVVPRFRSGDFSHGIVEGVQALEQIARVGPSAIAASGKASSSSPSPRGGAGGSGSLIGCGGFGVVVIFLLIFFIIRMLGGVLGGFGRRSYSSRRYRRGPGMGTGMLGGLLLGHMLGGGRRSSSPSSWGGGFGGGGGGGFSGGSFGGGFSGGRGASGSW